MGNFYGGDRGGDRRDGGNRGGFGGGRSGGFQKKWGNDRGGDRGGRNGDVTMHKTICAECKKECEVPFRPNGDKPVYCKDCFGVKREESDREFHGREKADFGNNAPRDFKPEFRSNPTAQVNRPNDDVKKQLAEISSKLDRLVNSIEKLLPKTASTPAAMPASATPVASVSTKPEVKKVVSAAKIEIKKTPVVKGALSKVIKAAVKPVVKSQPKVAKKVVAKKVDTKKKK